MNTRRKKIKINVKQILLMLILIFVIIKIIGSTVSRFQSSSQSSADLGIAYYVLNDGSQNIQVNLGELLPRTEPYVYNFTISNFRGTNIAETDMKYDLSIRTTTNLPLSFELYKNEARTDVGAQSIIETTGDLAAVRDGEDSTDTTATYFKTYVTDTSYFSYNVDETNTYSLVVYFPSIYNTIDYQDLIESIEIIIESEQII